MSSEGVNLSKISEFYNPQFGQRGGYGLHLLEGGPPLLGVGHSGTYIAIRSFRLLNIDIFLILFLAQRMRF